MNSLLANVGIFLFNLEKRRTQFVRRLAGENTKEGVLPPECRVHRLPWSGSPIMRVVVEFVQLAQEVVVGSGRGIEELLLLR